MEKTWNCKDSCRCYWRVTCKPYYDSNGDQTYERDPYAPDDKHFFWEFSVEKQDIECKWVEVYNGVILGQYDNMPSLRELMLEFQSHINNLVIEMLTTEQNKVSES